VRRHLGPLGYIGLVLDTNGMLKVLPKEVDFKGSMNVIFIPMNELSRNRD